MLTSRGLRIEKPHRYHCKCPSCYHLRKLDSFSYSLFRLNAFSALASPAYIAIAAHDPMIWCLHLSKELKMMSIVENEFKNEYYRLAMQECGHFFISHVLLRGLSAFYVDLSVDERPRTAWDMTLIHLNYLSSIGHSVLCTKLTVDLLNLCWSTSEISAILNGNYHMKIDSWRVCSGKFNF